MVQESILAAEDLLIKLKTKGYRKASRLDSYIYTEPPINFTIPSQPLRCIYVNSSGYSLYEKIAPYNFAEAIQFISLEPLLEELNKMWYNAQMIEE